MTNSSLISYTKLSPNYTAGRNHIIDKITPHYMGGDCSIETCGEIFQPKARRASSNYGIGSDGRIGLYVAERNRAWTSGNSANDNRAVTIECANRPDGSLTQACWDSLVALCVDICRRNNIAYLNYTGGPTGNLTMHKWFQDTDCPGPWLSKKFGELADTVNEILLGTKPSPTPAHDTDFGGAYQCQVQTLNVRAEPNLFSLVVASYKYGEVVNLDNWFIVADGYVWGRYTGGQSGMHRYVAIGRNTGKVEDDDFLIKIG